MIGSTWRRWEFILGRRLIDDGAAFAADAAAASEFEEEVTPAENQRQDNQRRYEPDV